MNWLTRLFATRDDRLPDAWRPQVGTWSDQSGVMEGRCPPLETYVMDRKPELLKSEPQKRAVSR